MQNSFCTRGNNIRDVYMSNHRRVPWGRATFCRGYYLLMDRPADTNRIRYKFRELRGKRVR